MAFFLEKKEKEKCLVSSIDLLLSTSKKKPQTRLNFPKLKLVFVAAFPLLH